MESKHTIIKFGIALFVLMLVFVVSGCGRGNRRNTNIPSIGSSGEEVNECSGNEIHEAPLIPNTPIVPVAHVRIALPLKHVSVNSDFGERKDPFTGKKKQHNGLDLSAFGDSAMAMLPGKVLDAGENKNAGKYVLLQHGEISIAYCHLSEIIVHKGQTVVPGSILGITGSTGRSSGEHLHLTCKLAGKYIDPYIIISAIQSACGQAKEGEECTIEEMLY